MTARPLERTPAERYGVTRFDLDKKQRVIDLSESTVQALQKKDLRGELTPFCLGINELHFDRANGLLVSEAEALQVFRESVAAGYSPDNSFVRFLKEQRIFLDTPTIRDLTLPSKVE